MTSLRNEVKLAKIGSANFKRLDFKEQLFILNLYYHDQDNYLNLCGLPPKELEYVDDYVSSIFSLPRTPTFSADPSIFPSALLFHENCWCAYLAYFNPKWWEEELNPVDLLGHSYKRVLNIQLFNFPLISFDLHSLRILRWLRTQASKTRGLSDIFFYLVKMRAAQQYFMDEGKQRVVDVWNESIVQLNEYVSVLDINDTYPIIESSTLIDLIEEDTYAPIFNSVRPHNDRFYVPLVPAELYNKSQFTVKGWDFLL